MTLVYFLALAFGISLIGFACVALIPSAKSPETLTGLPFWLVMVWGPSLAAIILSMQAGTFTDLMARAVRVSSVPWEVWILVLLPLILVALMAPNATGEKHQLSAGMIVLMVGFNLCLGPLGEELGWRGVMQEHLNGKTGWLTASFIVGAVWFVWHLPLWTIDSPHAQISLHLFGIHCMLYAVIIGAAYTLSGGSILPAILLHLTFNLASNMAVFAGFEEPDAWFSTSILPYLALAVASIALVFFKMPQANAFSG